MILKFIIGFALAGIVIWSTPFAEGKINHVQEFCGDKYCGQYNQKVEYKKEARVKKYKTHKKQAKPKLIKMAMAVPVASEFDGIASVGGNLVAEAKRYLGTNPTGWGSVWCGRFMAMIAPSAAARVKNPNWARDWAALPKTAPRVGAIAVLKRGRGGHIGVVSGFDRQGNPIIISGNHNRRVGEGVYSKHRVIAYVSG